MRHMHRSGSAARSSEMGAYRAFATGVSLRRRILYATPRWRIS